MLVSQNGYRRNYLGQWTKKPVSQLNNSDHYVLVRCDDCGRLGKTTWSNRKGRLAQGRDDLCNSCSKSGARNPQYGKDRSALLARARTFQQYNPMLGKHHSLSARSKMSKIKAEHIADGTLNILADNWGQKSWHESPKTGERSFADSALELFRMWQLDGDPAVESWTKRHGIKIQYELHGVQRYCVPDFLIIFKDGTRLIEEVKGNQLESDREIAKKEAMIGWCQREAYAFRYLPQSELNENGEYRKFLRRGRQCAVT